MSVLLIAEHDNKEVRPFTLNAITAAKGEEIYDEVLTKKENNLEKLVL